MIYTSRDSRGITPLYTDFHEDEETHEFINDAYYSVYDQYPGDRAKYPKGRPLEYPYPSQYFQEYSVGEVIGKSSAKDPDAPIIVTSGELRCANYGGKKQAFTDTYNFRMLMNGMDSEGVRVGWTDSITNASVTPVAKDSNGPSWAGMHLFSRYQTSNDLYVASYRFDGKVTIKKKIAGKYTTLAVESVDKPVMGESYLLQFTVSGDTLSLFVNGSKKASVRDSDLVWGTSGVRLDYCDCYIENVRMTSPKLMNDTESNECIEDEDTNGGGFFDSFYNYLKEFFQ